ncbi:MAG: hypothetical protein ACKOZV_18605 [Bacteroidota bacterium]
MENYQSNDPQFANEVRTFYQQDFKHLLMAFFQDPVNGLYGIFANPPAKGFMQSVIIISSVFVLFFAGSYLASGDMREYMKFSAFLSIGTIPVFIMLFITLFSFVIKAATGRADFKSEMLTGALGGLPLGLIMVVLLVLRLFGEGMNPFTMFSSPLSGGWLMTVVVLYFFLMMVNVLQQSLRSAGIKDVLAWYLSPVSILLSVYLGVSIVQNLF